MFLKFCEVPGGVHLQFKNTCTLDLILQITGYRYLYTCSYVCTCVPVHMYTDTNTICKYKIYSLLLLEGVPQLYLLYNLL
jgi:hypothetical protein